MAKKFVRGVTGVDDIESFDKTLTNVNDILSDGQDTYIHTRKGKVESYYNLTDSVKQVKNTDGTLTISKDDAGTVSISNSGLATKEELASKQDTLSVGDGLALTNNKIGIKPTNKNNVERKNGIYSGSIDGDNLKNLIISLDNNNDYIQLIFRESGSTPGRLYIRNRFLRANGTSTDWRELIVDSNQINDLLYQKQNTLLSSTSIGVLPNNTLKQVYFYKKTYTDDNGVLTTHAKSIAQNNNINANEHEYNFIIKINKGVSSVEFTLNSDDTTDFTNIINKYGSNNTVCINGCVLTLSESTLTVSTTNNTEQNYVITFSDII